LTVYDPSRYREVPARELLEAAARGWIGVDRRLLQALLERGPAAAADVVAFAKSDPSGHRVDIDPLVVDLLRHWRTPAALDVFLEIIRRHPEEVADELVEAILPYREQAVEPLLALYEELGEERGGEVAFLLAGLRVRDARILAVLLDRLEYDAADGALCLGLYGDPEARPALERMLAEIPAEDVELRRELEYALEQLKAPEPAYEPEPRDVLQEYPAEDTPPLDLLDEPERTAMLASPDAATRAAAALTFFNQELSPPARDALLRLAEQDPDPKVRGQAWASLADVAGEPALRDKMVAIVTDASRAPEERGGAAVGLYGVADQPAVAAAIEALYREGGPTRARALEAMWRSLWEPFAKYFPENLGDRDPEVVRQALRGAGYFQLTREIEKIASYFHRDEPFDSVREDALFAYALAMPGPTSRGHVRGLLRKIDELAQLSEEEEEVVKFALDERLRLHGLRPVFDPAAEEQESAAPPTVKVGRNDPCPCGSGKKFKKCHGA
jgi:hypothetical protein